MMIARLLISPDPSGSESGLSAEDDSVTVTTLVDRHWHSSGRMTTPYGPSCRTTSGGMRHGEAYQQASGRGGPGLRHLEELIHVAAIDAAMEAELAATLGAGRYERRDGRQVYRNGTKTRTLSRPTGALALTLPPATRGSLGSGRPPEHCWTEWRSRFDSTELRSESTTKLGRGQRGNRREL